MELRTRDLRDTALQQMQCAMVIGYRGRHHHVKRDNFFQIVVTKQGQWPIINRIAVTSLGPWRSPQAIKTGGYAVQPPLDHIAPVRPEQLDSVKVLGLARRALQVVGLLEKHLCHLIKQDPGPLGEEVVCSIPQHFQGRKTSPVVTINRTTGGGL